MADVKKQFGDERHTVIVDADVEFSIEDLIKDEDVAITVTKAGYIKRTPVSTYSRQGRGGKGRYDRPSPLPIGMPTPAKAPT